MKNKFVTYTLFGIKNAVWFPGLSHYYNWKDAMKETFEDKFAVLKVYTSARRKKKNEEV